MVSKSLQLLTRYNLQLERRPIFTKMWSAGTLFAVGDIMCQMIFEKKTFKKGLDFRRTLIMTSVGSLYGAPLLHFWYGTVVKIAGSITKNPKYIPLLSTAIDQTMFSPFCLGTMLFLFEFVDKRDIKKSVQNVKDKLWPTLLGNWKVWPLAMFVNFTFVPPNFRVLFSNFVGVFWNVYLSWMQNVVKINKS